MPSAPITVIQGTSCSPLLQRTTDGTTPVTGFLSSDVLTARVWIGEDQPILFSPSVAWIDASIAKFQLFLSAGNTATLTPGTYYVQILATRGSSVIKLFDESILITPAPGTATALTSYCTYRDMQRFAPWVSRLQSQSDLAGFAQERQDARNWFDDLLQRHFRGGSGLSPDLYFIPGIAFMGGMGGYGGGYLVPYRPGIRSKQLQDWLDADRLDVTSEVIKANAAYAIAQVAKAQIVPGNDKSSAYSSFYAHFEAMAEHTAQLITAELDSDGDGTNDTAIRLGIADTLEG